MSPIRNPIMEKVDSYNCSVLYSNLNLGENIKKKITEVDQKDQQKNK